MNIPFHVTCEIKVGSGILFDNAFYPVSQLVFAPNAETAKEMVAVYAEEAVRTAEDYGYKARMGSTTIVQLSR